MIENEPKNENLGMNLYKIVQELGHISGRLQSIEKEISGNNVQMKTFWSKLDAQQDKIRALEDYKLVEKTKSGLRGAFAGGAMALLFWILKESHILERLFQ